MIVENTYNYLVSLNDNSGSFRPVLSVFASIASREVAECVKLQNITDVNQLTIEARGRLGRKYYFMDYFHFKQFFASDEKTLINDREALLNLGVGYLYVYRDIIKLLNDLRRYHTSTRCKSYTINVVLRDWIVHLFTWSVNMVIRKDYASMEYKEIDRVAVERWLFVGDMFSLTGTMFFLSLFLTTDDCKALYNSIAKIALELSGEYRDRSSGERKGILLFFAVYDVYAYFTKRIDFTRELHKGIDSNCGSDSAVTLNKIYDRKMELANEMAADGLIVDSGNGYNQDVMDMDCDNARIVGLLKHVRKVTELGKVISCLKWYEGGDDEMTHRTFLLMAVKFIEFEDINVSWGKLPDLKNIGNSNEGPDITNSSTVCDKLVCWDRNCRGEYYIVRKKLVCKLKVRGEEHVASIDADTMCTILEYAFAQNDVRGALRYVFEYIFLLIARYKKANKYKGDWEVNYYDIRESIIYNIIRVNNPTDGLMEKKNINYILNTIRRILNFGVCDELSRDELVNELRRYKQFIHLLNLMSKSETAEDAHSQLMELFRYDQRLYRNIIEIQKAFAGVENIEERLSKSSTMLGLYELCVEYRRSIYSRFALMTENIDDFDPTQWRVNAELVWLNLPRKKKNVNAGDEFDEIDKLRKINIMEARNYPFEFYAQRLKSVTNIDIDGPHSKEREYKAFLNIAHHYMNELGIELDDISVADYNYTNEIEKNIAEITEERISQMMKSEPAEELLEEETKEKVRTFVESNVECQEGKRLEARIEYEQKCNELKQKNVATTRLGKLIIPKDKNIRRDLKVVVTFMLVDRHSEILEQLNFNQIQSIFNALQNSRLIEGSAVRIPYLNYKVVSEKQLLNENKEGGIDNILKLSKTFGKYVYINCDDEHDRCLQYYLSCYDSSVFRFIDVVQRFEKRVLDKHAPSSDSMDLNFKDIIQLLVDNGCEDIKALETAKVFIDSAVLHVVPDLDLKLQVEELDFFKVGRECIETVRI